MTRNGQSWTILAAPFEKTLAASPPADLIAFSPPYVDARTYDDAPPFGMDDYARLGDACFAACKPGAHVLINVDAPVRDYRPEIGSERGLHPFRLAIDWADRVGFRFVERMAFGRMGAPGEYRGRFRGVRDLSGWAVDNNMTHRGTYWAYLAAHGQTGSPDLEATDHPARWPYRLASDIVRVFCPPGGLVVDPFVGSGTTAIAATDHERAFFGGDLSPRWAAEASRIMGVVAPPSLSLFAFGAP